MNNLQLSLAMGDYDRTRPIRDGRVRIDGVDPICMLLSPEEMFFRAFRHQAFDASELSISSYSISVARGDPHYVAIPVFLSRAFRHTSIYIRTDKGIEGLVAEGAKEHLLGRKEHADGVDAVDPDTTVPDWPRPVVVAHGERELQIVHADFPP